MVEAFLALGSNIGDQRENLKKALLFLGEKLHIVKISSIYETEPMYVEDQEWFLNCVVKAVTELSPRALLDFTMETEQRIGRKRDNDEKRYGPRIIDIDILFYGDSIVSEKDLEIPHPRIQERLFVLIPLAEIDPSLVHPVCRKNITQLLGELHSNKTVRIPE